MPAFSRCTFEARIRSVLIEYDMAIKDFLEHLNMMYLVNLVLVVIMN